jgi:hypothetical protein
MEGVEEEGGGEEMIKEGRGEQGGGGLSKRVKTKQFVAYKI